MSNCLRLYSFNIKIYNYFYSHVFSILNQVLNNWYNCFFKQNPLSFYLTCFCRMEVEHNFLSTCLTLWDTRRSLLKMFIDCSIVCTHSLGLYPQNKYVCSVFAFLTKSLLIKVRLLIVMTSNWYRMIMFIIQYFQTFLILPVFWDPWCRVDRIVTCYLNSSVTWDPWFKVDAACYSIKGRSYLYMPRPFG